MGSSYEALVRVEDVVAHYPVRMDGALGRVRRLRAVDGVSLAISEGEALGLVGESGCGKSTIAKLILRLLTPSSGRIVFMGEDITGLGRRDMRPIRRNMQIVFQDPFASLNPGMRVGEIVSEPLVVHNRRQASPGEITELLDLVGLHPGDARKYPHEFSGGQRQRISIARALALRPKLLVLDEPVSALDVSIQAQIINLLIELKQKLGLAYLFIAHDLSVVRHVSDRVAVMYMGRIVEHGLRDEVFSQPDPPGVVITNTRPPDPK
ncbi:MAG: ABC transporter ATP-binding protein [Acidimicrobiia bacterium]|nr:ABC transporter ATP-binding protein [Acidimicrobiia bacterium]